MSGFIQYRFRSEKDVNRVSINSHEVSVKQLRDKISDIKGLKEDPATKKKGPNPSYTLLMINNITMKEYSDENQMIPAGTEIIVKRVPSSRPTTIFVNPSTTEIQEIKIAEEDDVKGNVYTTIAKQILDGSSYPFLICEICEGMLEDPVLGLCACNYADIRSQCRACLQETCNKCKLPFTFHSDLAMNTYMQLLRQEIESLEPHISESLAEIVQDDELIIIEVPLEDINNSMQTSEIQVPAEVRDFLKARDKTESLLLLIDKNSQTYRGICRHNGRRKKRSDGTYILNVEWLLRSDLKASKLIHLKQNQQALILMRSLMTVSNPIALRLIGIMESQNQVPLYPFKPFEEPKDEDKKRKRRKRRSAERKRSKRSRSRSYERRRRRHRH